MANLTVRASSDFSVDSPEEKVSNGEIIVTLIAEPAQAARLTNLTITGAALTALNVGLKQGIKDAADGGHSAIAARNALEAKWVDGFQELVKDVNLVGEGDKAFILSCGLRVTSEMSVPTPEAEIVVNLSAKPTEKTGEIIFSNDKQKQAAAYLYGAFPAGTIITQNGSTITITNGSFSCYLSPNTHQTTTMQGLPSDVPFIAAALAFNLKGLGPVTFTAKVVRPE